MPIAAATAALSDGIGPPPLTDLTADAVAALDQLLISARGRVRARVERDGRIAPDLLDREQRAAHGLAWLATYVEALRELASYTARMRDAGRFGAIEEAIVRIGFGEYLAQIAGGIAMSQGEIVRLADLGLTAADMAPLAAPAIVELIATGNTAEARAALIGLIEADDGALTVGDAGIDETLDQFRAEMRKFCRDEVIPYAHHWHLANAYIPMEVIARLADLGVFGLTIPEAFGGLGLTKESMCVVTEELSRGYIGVGSLGTRSEIAAELILCGGTDAQKAEWLPKIASGEVLPTAVFTEPNTGSDLGALRTRAVKDGETYRLTGNKTWITHPVRADVMTVLARTNPETSDYRGLSMFLAPKLRGDDDVPFPAAGMSGGEIEVLGYRGMKEFEIAFDGFAVPAANLLGGVEGQGFKQLMQTFESARIQTAARAVGVAQNAFDLGLRYALDRVQFGKALIRFPRVADKLAMIAVETMIARQLTYFAARQKDLGRRCDLEAGMAKLLGARVAWGAADNALQIHGGNGFALEYPISRLLCDARILNIFEGAGEIQAHVIARRVLEGVN
jgi:(2S)-methylsuccinyl-CoA dehydrogenase